MSFVRGSLTAEQKARIEANRKRALERLQNKGLTKAPLSQPPVENTQQLFVPAEVPTNKSEVTNPAPLKKPKIELTPEQRKQIEENRKKALDIQKQRQKQNRDAENTATSKIPLNPAILERQGREVRLPKDVLILANSDKDSGSKTNIGIKKAIHKRDYIEYDFASMKDTYGGFLDVQEPNGVEAEPENPTLEAWKEKQRKEHIIREAPPPIDISTAPRCFECGSLEIDANIYDNFRKIRVCVPCRRAKPEKYALLTKTECKEDYLLTDPELKDTELLARIEKPNPHGYSRMQLFLRLQVEEFAWKKWGGPDQLDEEWEKRERLRLQRKEKKYESKLKEMRKRTRAEEYTRKLRNGESLGSRHVHDWSEPLVDGDICKRRCIDCGLETEEVMI